jgi:hypothetical protein
VLDGLEDLVRVSVWASEYISVLMVQTGANGFILSLRSRAVQPLHLRSRPSDQILVLFATELSKFIVVFVHI